MLCTTQMSERKKSGTTTPTDTTNTLTEDTSDSVNHLLDNNFHPIVNFQISCTDLMTRLVRSAPVEGTTSLELPREHMLTLLTRFQKEARTVVTAAKKSGAVQTEVLATGLCRLQRFVNAATKLLTAEFKFLNTVDVSLLYRGEDLRWDDEIGKSEVTGFRERLVDFVDRRWEEAYNLCVSLLDANTIE